MRQGGVRKDMGGTQFWHWGIAMLASRHNASLCCGAVRGVCVERVLLQRQQPRAALPDPGRRLCLPPAEAVRTRGVAGGAQVPCAC